MNYTPITLFTDTVISFVESGILGPIADHIRQTYKEEASREEIVKQLVKVLNIEQEGYQEIEGALTIKMPSVKGPVSRRNVTRKATSDETRCVYIYQKHPRKGQQCEEERSEGSEYCNKCSRNVKRTIKTTSELKQGKIGFTKGISNTANKMLVNADPMNEYPGCFKLIEYGYVAKLATNGKYVCVAKEKDGVLVTLSEDNEKECEDLGFKYAIIDDVIDFLKSGDDIDIEEE
jgi:hypothetical protein